MCTTSTIIVACISAAGSGSARVAAVLDRWSGIEAIGFE
jgi:hypothetical protein